MFSNIYDIVFCRKRQERKTGSPQGLVLHRRYAQAAEKNVQTDYVCSGAQGAPCKLQVWWHYRRPHPPCRGAACRSRRCTGAINKLPLKWQILPICHCEEAIAFLTLARTSRRCGAGGHAPPLQRMTGGLVKFSTFQFHFPRAASLHMCYPILQKGLLRGSCSRPFAPREGNRQYQRWTTVPASPRTAAPACASEAMMACPPVLANETAALTFGSMEPGAKCPSSQ